MATRMMWGSAELMLRWVVELRRWAVVGSGVGVLGRRGTVVGRGVEAAGNGSSSQMG